MLPNKIHSDESKDENLFFNKSCENLKKELCLFDCNEADKIKIINKFNTDINYQNSVLDKCLLPKMPSRLTEAVISTLIIDINLDMTYLPNNEIKNFSRELQHNLSLCNVKSVYKNKIIDLIDHVEYSIGRGINSAFDILSAIELLNNKIIYGNFDAACANKFILHSHYNQHQFLKLNYDLEYINRDFNMINYESKKLVLDNILQEYKREFFETENNSFDGFVFGNIKVSDPKQRNIFLRKLVATCSNIFKEDSYFKNNYVREILTDKLNILEKSYFLVEEFETLLRNLTKDNIKNKKLIDIFKALERASFLVDEYKLDYRIPIEFIEIIENRIEKETLTEGEKSYLDNPYNPLILDMIGCNFKYFK